MVRKEKKINFVLIAVVYLLGIFMGAIDTGIVTPARTIIQNDLMVNENTGIWMITIYTLAYAASIPIMGKLADKFGRKYIYLISISLFGIGSLFCGLSQNFESFSMLLIARVVQAIGGGGIVPIATAEFGTTFPKEKRGLALGLVGGVYGVANIFGASAGSAIIDIFGQSNWQYIFYINVPITIFILVAGFLTLPNTKITDVKKIDFLGITTVTLMVLSILYGLKNIDYFDFKNTFLSTSVYPYLIAFIVLLPIFILIEKKAEDPVINISYFKNVKIIITLFIAFITGIIIMGMIFVPQFSENSLKIATGSGGYFVIILGIFAGVGAPFSGKLIDKYGAKVVLGFGFISSIAGSLYLILYAADHPSLFSIVVCLILLGIGIGFTMGTPINYMMLDNTRVEEANSALATVSLVRSIGTAVAPAIMIGFISHGGMAVQDNIKTLLPNEVNVPELPYAEELTEEFTALKSNPSMADKLEGIEIPDLTAMETIKFDMNSDNGSLQLSDEILDLLKSSDVTTITDNTKVMAEYIFTQMTPSIIDKIEGGIDSGITGISDSVAELNNAIVGMSYNPAMAASVEKMKSAKAQMEDTIEKMTTLEEAIPGAFEKGKENYLVKIEDSRGLIEKEYQTTLNKAFQQVYATVAIASVLALIVLMLYKEEKATK
ncbi:MFS transporter [Clostridium sp. AL.422]|uniref:MFS transporter n=1 Tax=Clostridium TaxID=1485 RepID=UPI00293DBB16|nr:MULTISPECIES: MFS transporter [unclassified Clostridium]MDV4149939.1 MFS transporter [Clostridium sp. AL.422]